MSLLLIIADCISPVAISVCLITLCAFYVRQPFASTDPTSVFYGDQSEVEIFADPDKGGYGSVLSSLSIKFVAAAMV
eukprot:gene31820-53087_t